MNWKEHFASYLRAGYPLVYVHTHEEQRAISLIRECARELGLEVSIWAASCGWNDYPDARDPVEALVRVQGFPEGRVCVLLDYHPYLEEPLAIRTLRDLLPLCKGTGRYLVILSPVVRIPPELEKDTVVVELPLPDRSHRERIVSYIEESVGAAIDGNIRDGVVEALAGLSASEAENVLALAYVRHRGWTPEVVDTIHEEKARLLKNTGVLEYFRSQSTLEDVGGLDLLKAWLARRRKAFLPQAREFGLPAPRGVLLLGVQGCGKSLVAKATARSWGLPLLRLDMGKVFASLVGESERNIRNALMVAEAVSPVVLWVDEIEKGAAGVYSSGVTDSGVTARVVGTLLTWMQERDPEKIVFLAVTANSVWSLPPELIRKGRLDEIFFVDLPEEEERVEILAIHLRKRGRDPERYDLRVVAAATDGFSGAELEQVVIDALYYAWDEGRDVETADLLKAAGETVPLARTRGEEISKLREWAKTHARPASSAAARRYGVETHLKRSIRLQ